MAAVNNLKLDQGADSVFTFALRDKSGPLNLTGFSAAMQLRTTAYSAEAIDTLTTCNGRLVIDAEAGKITATFPHAITEKYPAATVVYDLEIESPAGEITRALEGKIRISPEVTRVRCNQRA